MLSVTLGALLLLVKSCYLVFYVVCVCMLIGFLCGVCVCVHVIWVSVVCVCVCVKALHTMIILLWEGESGTGVAAGNNPNYY